MSTQEGLIKPYASKFALVARSLDSLCIILALCIVGALNSIASNSEFWLTGLLGCLIHQILSEFTEIYRSWRSETLWAEAKQVATSWFVAFTFVFLLGIYWPLASEIFTWPKFAQWFILSLCFLNSWRVVVRSILRLMRIYGFNTRKAAVVGTGTLARQVAERLESSSWTGYRFLGFFDDRKGHHQGKIDCCRRDPCLMNCESNLMGGFDNLVEMAESGKLDCIYIALPMRSEKRIRELVDRLSNSTASVYVVPDLFVFELLYARTVNLNGLPAIGVVGEPMRDLNSWLKRLEDIVVASVILALICIPMLIIALVIKSTSRGPVIFKQNRYGMDGKSIEVWKFRSMTVTENGDDFKQATKNDSRITKVGGFLRKTSLDELPQFINVLQGTMSVVGPRPHAIKHNEEFRPLIKSYMRRHKIRPGITGWAQVNGWRGETDCLEKMQKRIEFDLQYIHNWSVWWDLSIIIKTIFSGFVGKNAY